MPAADLAPATQTTATASKGPASQQSGDKPRQELRAERGSEGAGWAQDAPTVFAKLRGMATLYDFSANTIDGQPQPLDAYRGQVLLIVNVASQCGFTPQYTGLEALYRKHKSEGFAVLGFPCDQFGHQEPGDEAEIKNFCSLRYDVTFPLFAKIHVNGDDTHPLYRFLKSEKKGLLSSEAIKWNFTKFLVDRHGKVVKRYAPQDKPESLEKDLQPLLEAR